ncbi:MAG: hypothetical protein JW904_06975 [Spirochaetales bacterium]|nr:hypothetical protein [Spirochaetales bacterium]
MNSVTRKLIFLLSFTFILIGVVLIVFQLNFIPNSVTSVFSFAVKLWPIVLILAGIMFLRDSFSRRYYLNRYELKEKSIDIPLPKSIQEIRFEIEFSFGNFTLARSKTAKNLLVYDQYGPMPEPIIDIQELGLSSIIKMNKSKPYLSPHFRIQNSWSLSLAGSIPCRFDISIIEADIALDFNGLELENLELHATNGVHRINFGSQKKKINAIIYSASSQLLLTVPVKSFVRVNLKNPFCMLEYPQGDFMKNEDGTFISTKVKNSYGLIEISIDGPIKNLVLDIAE